MHYQMQYLTSEVAVVYVCVFFYVKKNAIYGQNNGQKLMRVEQIAFLEMF